LDEGVRWICRTPDQDALGLVLPSTSEPEGYTAEKAKGNVVTVPGGGHWHFDLEIGALGTDEAAEVEGKIEQILAAAAEKEPEAEMETETETGDVEQA
jgi:hypothetical protein